MWGRENLTLILNRERIGKPDSMNDPQVESMAFMNPPNRVV